LIFATAWWRRLCAGNRAAQRRRCLISALQAVVK
jgi:transposase